MISTLGQVRLDYGHGRACNISRIVMTSNDTSLVPWTMAGVGEMAKRPKSNHLNPGHFS